MKFKVIECLNCYLHFAVKKERTFIINSENGKDLNQLVCPYCQNYITNDNSEIVKEIETEVKEWYALHVYNREIKVFIDKEVLDGITDMELDTWEEFKAELDKVGAKIQSYYSGYYNN